MDVNKLETETATPEEVSLFRVQIPPDDVSKVVASIVKIDPLKYGNYEQVIFRHHTGTQQFRPLDGSRLGESELVHIPCDEISFVVPKHDETVRNVVEAIHDSHPHEEPVIIIHQVLRSQFKYDQPCRNGTSDAGQTVDGKP